MDPNQLSTLQNEQKKAIAETNARIDALNDFKKDYEVLCKRLETLPDHLSYDVMVPFGKLAFMPGKLAHTNEILVLLGDNWFVERSAKQAAQIAKRRIQSLEKDVFDLKEQKNLLKPRLDFTTTLQSELQGKEDVKEIIEEYDEDKEKLWEEKHRINVRGYYEEQRKEVEHKAKEITDKSIWSRLDELERQEDERNEMNDSDSESDQSDCIKDNKKQVRWRECRAESDDNLTDEEDDETSEDSDLPEERVETVIRFSHTPAKSETECSPISPAGDASIVSPADIYKLYKPKSILKSTSETHCENKLPETKSETISSLPRESYNQAFTGRVVEKASVTDHTSDLPTESAPTKRISKFKAQRLKNNPL